MAEYIAHVCVNSKLPPIQKGIDGKEKIDHPDYCERGFVDISPCSSSIGEQCWKYCPECEAKGFVSKPYKKNELKVLISKKAHEESLKNKKDQS